MKELRTLVLAAGKGTRMKSIVPKVLHEICGKPMINYVLRAVKSVGSLKTYVILGHKAKMIEDVLGKEYVFVQQKSLLGTADAVRSAESKLKSFSGDLLVLCGDTPLLRENTLKEVVKRHRISKAACTFLTTVVHDPYGYGRVIRDDQGNAVAIREEKDAVGFEKNIAEINVGVYCFKSRDLFRGLKELKINKKKKEFYLTDIIENFRDKALKVQTVEVEDNLQGLGINTKEDLAKAQKVIRKRILSRLMLSGVTIEDPDTTYIEEGVKIGEDTVIKPYTFIEHGVRIGKRSVIGPFARIRPDTKIGNQVEVGNFTEISRAKLGDRIFMKHFSYIGDSVLGADVNVGAGAITANFDGKEKHETKILDKAFVGSGSILVAPVKMGKGSVLGAGSVLVKNNNIPDGAVAVGSPAKIKKGKKRK